MHNNNLVVAVKSDGSVLREHGSTVYLPFGSNYSLLIKNLDSESKASVNVEIDGEDALKGRSLIVNSDDSVELKRFINSSLDRGNRFKFIEATDEIRENRSDNSMNGIIKVTYQFEKKSDAINHIEELIEEGNDVDWEVPWYIQPKIKDYTVDYNYSDYTETFQSAKSNTTNILRNQSFNYEGITAPGEVIDQGFKIGNIGKLEPTRYTITLQLKGKNTESEDIEEPLTTEDKIECSTCGRKYDSSYKYCPQCGTSLVII